MKKQETKQEIKEFRKTPCGKAWQAAGKAVRDWEALMAKQKPRSK